MQRDAFTDTENVDQEEPCDAFTNPGGWRSQQRSADPGSEVQGQRGTDLKCHLSPDPLFALALTSNSLWPRQWGWGDAWEVDSWNVEQLEVGVQYQDQEVGARGCQKEEDVLLHLWEPGSDVFF